jgi:diketogulonate reductase-like aldo/keto reductase
MSYSPAYQSLPTSHKDEQITTTVKAQKPNKQNKNIFWVFAVLAILYAALTAIRHISQSNFKHVRWLGGCHGTQRNTSGLPAHFTLPSGDKIPAVALGVWQAGPEDVKAAVKTALNAGYRHIDGAWAYGNEGYVGEALKSSSVPRDQVWLTSKLWNSFHAPEDIEPVLDMTLSSLGTSYVDLYLIHWPIAWKDNVLDEDLTANPYPTWQKLEELVEKGKIRNIGISNFNIRRIKNLTANPLKVRPAVNQVELNFWNPQPELLEWSKENGLLLQAYSPLGSNQQVGRTLSQPDVKAIAAELGITPAQVVISWHIQRGTVVLPKSVTPSHIENNFQVVALPQESFDRLEKAATSHEPQRIMNPSKDWGLDFDIFDD